MTDLFSYLLPYPAVLLFCDSKLQPFTNLPSKLIVTALLVDSRRSSLVAKQREYQINTTFSWMLPRLSYGFYSNCYFNWHEKEEINIWCRYISTGIELRNQFNWQKFSWCQISKSSLLYICISIRIFQLMWNICDCFFHCAAWVIIQALLVRRFYNCMYGQFPPHLLWS